MPSRVVSTGWPSVRDKCADLGIRFRWWQHPLGQIILSKRADGKYASTIGGTGLSIPRQVGKTFLVGAIVFALCMLRPGLTVIWTAHRLRTAEETFGKMQKFARRVKIKPYIEKVVLGSGEEEIRFHNGSRILFGARESGFGLGFDEVDVLIFDEAQRLRDMTLDDMIPATNQSRQETGALLLFMGTPPRPTDSGEVFTRMRTDCLSGEDADTGWVEFGADPGFVPTPKPAPMTEEDWRQLAKANPSFPDDTPREAILRMRKQLSIDSFPREGYGIWDEVNLHKAIVPMSKWAYLRVPTGNPDRYLALPEEDKPPSAIGLDMSFRRAIAISGAWSMDDRVHAEVLSLGELDTTTAVEWLKARAGRRIPVVVDAMSPAASMVPALEKAKVKIVVTGGNEMGKACGAWFDLVKESNFSHIGQDQLNEAVAKARKRLIGKAGLWGLDRADEESDISSLVSVVLAVHGAVAKARPERPKRSRVTVMS